MILHIPVRRRVVKIDGAQRSVLELDNGFVTVTPDGPPKAGEVESPRLTISNPLSEVFQDLYNRGFITAYEKVFVELEELQYSNPGDNDEATSLNHLDVIV